jgi:ribosomal protein S18 acetylase RimI-like enzyme
MKSQIDLEIAIRRAKVSDVVPLTQMARDTFYHTYAAYNDPENMNSYIDMYFTEDRLRYEVKDKNAVYLLAESNNQLCGYIKLKWAPVPRENFTEKTLEIARLYAATEYIGKGIGSLLMEKAMRYAKRNKAELVWLDVWKGNEQAIRFYKKCGFVVFKNWKFTLGNDIQDDYIMLLRLNET